MKFEEVFIENVGKRLKRIRIKVDPRHASFENYRFIDSYEGYILEENAQFIKLMVIKTGSPVVEVPQDALMEPALLDHFKYFVMEHAHMSDTEPAFVNVKNAARYEDVEIVLKQRGTTDTELVNLYREFIKGYE